jgi:hypothetical protein
LSRQEGLEDLQSLRVAKKRNENWRFAKSFSD